MLSDWQQTTWFHQFNVQNRSVLQHWPWPYSLGQKQERSSLFRPNKNYKFTVFDAMTLTLVLKLDLDIMMTYTHTKMRSTGKLVQKLSARNTDTKTEEQTDLCKTFTYLLSWVVIISQYPGRLIYFIMQCTYLSTHFSELHN